MLKAMKYKKRIALLFGLGLTLAYVLRDTASNASAGNKALKATIIFDMSGVLVKNSKRAASACIGLKYFIPYILSFNSPKKAEKVLFDFLSALKPRHPDTPASMHKKKLLPQIMCDWLQGTCSSEQLLCTVDEGIKNNLYPFKSATEKKLVQAIAEFMFSPEQFVQAVTPVKEAVALVQYCAAQKDAQNNHLYRLVIVSNWDAQSFDLLCQKPEFKEIFDLFDDIVISGAIGKIKPDKTIFYDLFAKHGIDPDNDVCVFIDDQQENIDAFNQCGAQTTGILCTTIKKTRQQLRTLNVM